jgi:hypothetical protein
MSSYSSLALCLSSGSYSSYSGSSGSTGSSSNSSNILRLGASTKLTSSYGAISEARSLHAKVPVLLYCLSSLSNKSNKKIVVEKPWAIRYNEEYKREGKI